MPNRSSIDKKALASLHDEHEAAMRRIGLLHRVRRALLAVATVATVATVVAAVASWAALQTPPTSVPAPQPTVTTPAPCPLHPLTTTPAGGYVPQTASADDLEDC